MPSGDIYVDLAPMSVNKKSVSEEFWATLPKVVRGTVKKVIDNTDGFTTEQGSKKPRKRFYIDGAVTTLSTETNGRRTTVRCHVKLQVATYPEKSMFAFPSGNAKAEGGSSDKDIQYSAASCVEAVVEDLTAKAIEAMKNK
jgi:hypothetical protein